MGRNYEELHDPNAEYTNRELSAETMGVGAKRGGGRDVEITDVQCTMVDGNFPWTLVRVYTDADVVGTVASAHVGTALPNSLAVEFHSYELDWWSDLVEEEVIEEGYIAVPEEPGIGVTVDMDAVEEHMVDGETLFDEA